MFPKESKADFNNGGTHCTTATGGGSYSGKIICGPDISGATNGDGSSQEVWAGRTESFNSLTIFQASLFLTKNSRVNMGNNSTLIFDGGGCKAGTDGVGGDCPTDSDGTGKDKIWGKNILSIDSSEFYQGGGNNAVFYMRDVNSIRLNNGSVATFGSIKDKDAAYAMLEFIVNDSDLSISEIKFDNSNSFISNFYVSNNEKDRGKYRFNINGGIVAAKINSFTVENGDVILGGDILVEGGISNITLNNSDLLLNGNKLSQVALIDLRNGAIFKADPRAGEHTIEIGGGDNILLEDGSSMYAQNILLKIPSLNIRLSGENTFLSVDKISFDAAPNDFSIIEMAASIKAKAKIGILDATIPCINNGCAQGDKPIKFNGDKLSSYEIDKIIINNDYVSLNTDKAFIDIKNIDYQNSEIKLYAIGQSEDRVLHIGSINVLNDASNNSNTYKIDLRNQNAAIDSIKFKSADELDLTANSSKINFGNIYCDSCKITNIVGDGSSSISINNYNSGSGSTRNFFQKITMDVYGAYNSGGTFEASEAKLNFNSLNGIYDSIVLTSSTLNINSASDITLTNGSIDIDNDSALSINAAHVFKDPVNIDNKGMLRISAANNLGVLNNDGIAYLDGKSYINTINNNKELHLYSGAAIDNLTNTTDSTIYVYGGNYITNFNPEIDSKLVFKVDFKDSKPGLTIHEMLNPFNINSDPDILPEDRNLQIIFKGVSVLKPGLKNRYEIIKTEKGGIEGISADDFSNILGVLPPWLIHEEGINYNNGENASNGETAWISVHRLTNYKALIGAVPGYGSDSSIMNIAALIDSVVGENNITAGLEDVVNSLDLNSKCGFDDQLIYEAHQGVTILDISKAPCLYNMAANMNTLKPVSNEVYALYSHNNTQKSLDTLLEANREYVYSNEIYSWYKGDAGYTSLADKGYDKGFSGVNSMFFVGATIAPLNSINVSGMLGFGMGMLNGNSSFFDTTSNTLSAGLAGSYLANSYYASLSTAVGFTNFRTDRNIAFLDNEYSDNRDAIANSSLSVLELGVKAETGKEFIVNSNTFLTPKVFAGQSVLNNSGYKEFGSSGALKVDSSNLLVSEVGVGAELRRELIMPYWTGIKNAFWYPKVGINLVERFYNAPTTKMQFLGVADDAYASIVSANYSGILGQLYGSVLYQAQKFAVQVGYNGEITASGYMNHSLNATLKYSFR